MEICTCIKRFPLLLLDICNCVVLKIWKQCCSIACTMKDFVLVLMEICTCIKRFPLLLLEICTCVAYEPMTLESVISISFNGNDLGIFRFTIKMSHECPLALSDFHYFYWKYATALPKGLWPWNQLFPLVLMETISEFFDLPLKCPTNVTKPSLPPKKPSLPPREFVRLLMEISHKSYLFPLLLMEICKYPGFPLKLMEKQLRLKTCLPPRTPP